VVSRREQPYTSSIPGAAQAGRQQQQQQRISAFVERWQATLRDVVRLVGMLLGLDLEAAIKASEAAHERRLCDMESQLLGDGKVGQGGNFQPDMGPVWYEAFTRAGLPHDLAQLCAFLSLAQFSPAKYLSLPALLGVTDKRKLLIDSWEELVSGSCTQRGKLQGGEGTLQDVPSSTPEAGCLGIAWLSPSCKHASIAKMRRCNAGLNSGPCWLGLVSSWPSKAAS
jgi:hypothetical protein